MGSSVCLTWVITRSRQHKSTLTRPLCQPGNKSVTQSASPVSQPSWQQTRQVGQLGGQTSRIQDAGRSVSIAVSQIISQKVCLWGTDVNQSGGIHTIGISRAGQHKKHNRFQKEVWFYVSIWKNDPTSHLIYYLSKHVPNELMVSISSFKSSSTQHGVSLVNYDRIYSKTDDRMEY